MLIAPLLENALFMTPTMYSAEPKYRSLDIYGSCPLKWCSWRLVTAFAGDSEKADGGTIAQWCDRFQRHIVGEHVGLGLIQEGNDGRCRTPA